MKTEHKNLAAALAAAQGAMEGAKKDSDNPFFKSKYADLSSVWDACRKPLSDNGLAVVQMPTVVNEKLGINTILMHESGERLDSFLPIYVSATAKPQEVGSAITYARRYALMAMVGIAAEDDDGNAAQNSTAQGAVKPNASSLAGKAKAIALEIELCDSLPKLNAIQKRVEDIISELEAAKANAWSERLKDVIQKRYNQLHQIASEAE